MALKEDLISSGEWLFRWRSYLPLIVILVIFLGLRDAWVVERSATPSLSWEALCFSVALFGLALRCLVAGTAPIGTSGRNVRQQVAFSLNTTGLYAIVRHPLYLANFFIMLGVVLYTRSVWTGLVTGLSFWLFYERIVLAEEAFLEQRFGQEFVRWAAQVPAFLPAFGKWRAAPIAFSWRTVLKREYNGFAAMTCIFVLMDLCGAWMVHHDLILSAPRRWMLGLALGIWLILRSLRKFTRLLHVAGR